MRRLSIIIAVFLCLNTPAIAEMYKIENPASNIYNPAARMDEPNPLSPPTQPTPQPTVTKTPAQPIPQTTVTKTKEITKPAPTTAPPEQVKELPDLKPQPNLVIPQKSYQFKSVRAYINAANNAYKQEDYEEFLSITEDALRLVRTGKLKASKKSKQTLDKYKVEGNRLLKL